MKLLGRLLSLIIVLALAGFVTAPGFAFYGIRSAADANDLAGLARLVDTGAVRASLRAQLSGDQTPQPSLIEDPIGAVRRQIEAATRAPGPSPDSFMTAQALGALTRGEGWDAPEDGIAVDTSAVRNPIPQPVFWSLTRARLAVADQDGARTIFTFERKGLYQWKLVHLSLPEQSPPSPAVAEARP